MRLTGRTIVKHLPLFPPPPPGYYQYGGHIIDTGLVSFYRSVERMGVYFYNNVIHPTEIGLYSKYYNRRVHGPYQYDVWYGPPETKLMDVKLNDLSAWVWRRNFSVGAFSAEFTRQMSGFMNFFHVPYFESPIRWLWRFVIFTSFIKFLLNSDIHQETEQAEYHW